MSPPQSQSIDAGANTNADDAAPVSNARYGYTVSHFGLLVPERVASEVVLQPTLFPMPLAPPWMIGLMNMRGSVAPVFDLRQLLQGELHARPTTVLLMDQGPWMVGLVVDKLPHTVAPVADGIEPQTIPETLHDFFRYAGHTANQSWWDFDHRACFAKLASAESS